jgi:hypothetical protein
MKVRNINEFTKGWFVGDFTPAVFQSKDFEIGHHKHRRSEKTFPHYHKETTELNYILKGTLMVSGTLLTEGQMWTYEKNEVSDVQFLTDVELIVIRWPSIPSDKYEVDSA